MEAVLAKATWRRLSWRWGTKGKLAERFAMLRVRVADRPTTRTARHLPGREVWLIGEWRANGERKYYLSNLPPRTPKRRLVAGVKARWVCEQAHQQLKQELGLSHFEGRSWTGLHRHALMTCIAFAYLSMCALPQRAHRKKGGVPATRRTTATAQPARRPPRCHRAAQRSSLRFTYLPALQAPVQIAALHLNCQGSAKPRPL